MGTIVLTPKREQRRFMHVISKRALRAYWRQRPDAENPLKAWFKETEAARWVNSAELKAKFGSASILDGKRVVFNIGGNKYRLLVWVHYRFGRVFIRWVGSLSGGSARTRTMTGST